MHYSEINHEAKIEEPFAEVDEDYGDRPVLLEGFTPVDGGDVIVPVEPQNPESFTLALTNEQAAQALLALASQIGKSESLLLIEELT